MCSSDFVGRYNLVDCLVRNTVWSTDSSDLGHIRPETQSNTNPNCNLFPRSNPKIIKLVTDARFQTATKRPEMS